MPSRRSLPMLATMAVAIAVPGAACYEPEASPQTVAPDVAWTVRD